jgi:ATP-binding cassette, subfamily C, bacterial CydD
MTTDEGRADGTRAWLEELGEPGRRWFDLSGGALALEALLSLGQWLGLARAAAGVMESSTSRVLTGLLGFALAGALASAARWVAGKLRERGAREIADRVRGRLLAHLLPAGRRTRETTSADAALAMVDLVDDVTDYHAEVMPLRRSAPFSMAVVLVATATLHWPAAIILVLSSVLLPLNMRLAGLFAQQGKDRQLPATQRLNAIVLDSFRGLRTLRALGAVDRRGVDLTRAADQLNAATMSVLRRAFLSGLVMDVVITFSIAANATYVGLALLGYVGVPWVRPLTLSDGLVVLLICPMYFTPMRATAAAYHRHERASAAADVLGDMTLRSTEPVHPRGPRRQPASEALGVVLDHVRFRHDDADGDTVSADLCLAPGTWTAVAGASGAGKSTLLALVAGMKLPTAGQVSWFTSATRHAPELGACAWLGQHTVLLDASVLDNIRLGMPDAAVGAVQQAVDAAGLGPTIDRLPLGLDTRLGEGGWGVSMGEARRIAIARAVLHGARLWLLDEPTAHLDTESESAVIAALRRATEGSTVVVATHSRALAAAADRVVALEGGRIRESGLVGV